MRAEPDISVIVPFATPEGAIATIRSLLAQSMQDFEIIAIPTSGEAEGDDLARIIDDRGIVQLPQANGLFGKAVNLAIERARGTYIAYCRGGDLAEPWRLHHQLEVISHRGSDAIFSPPTLVDPDGRVLSDSLAGHLFRPVGDTFDLFRQLLTCGNLICWSTAMVCARAIRETGPFREDLQSNADYDHWLRMVGAGKTVTRMQRRVVRHVMPIPRSAEDLGGFDATPDVLSCVLHALSTARADVIAKAFKDMIAPGRSEATLRDRAAIALTHPFVDVGVSAAVFDFFEKRGEGAPNDLDDFDLVRAMFPKVRSDDHRKQLSKPWI